MNRDMDIRSLMHNLKSLIAQKNWSERRFVEECVVRSVSERTVRSALYGKRLPKPVTLKEFAKVLGVTVGELFTLEPAISPTVSACIPTSLDPSPTTYEDFIQTPFGDLSACVLSDEEFRQFLEIDATAYGVVSYENSFLPSWRASFPRGCLGLFDGAMLIGGIGIWPIDDDTAKQIKAGTIHSESDLHCYQPGRRKKRISNWYLGGILIAEQYRMKGYLRPLIDLCFSEWLDVCDRDLHEPFEMVAVLVHRKLRAKFDRWGFRRERGLFQGEFPVVSQHFSTKQAFRSWIVTHVVPDLAPRASQ